MLTGNCPKVVKKYRKSRPEGEHVKGNCPKCVSFFRPKTFFTFCDENLFVIIFLRNSLFRQLLPPEAAARRSPKKSGWKIWSIISPARIYPGRLFLASKFSGQNSGRTFSGHFLWPEAFMARFFGRGTLFREGGRPAN